MTRNKSGFELWKKYLLWIAEKVDEDDLLIDPMNRDAFTHRGLFRLLDEVVFSPRFPMDQNRAEDGIELRYRFGFETGESPSRIAAELDIRPCSMLEMTAALALRCEEEFLYGAEEPNGAATVFRVMLRSLGLEDTGGRTVSAAEARDILEAFSAGRYARNGTGGLFAVRNRRVCMPELEIYEQMNIWLSEMREARR